MAEPTHRVVIYPLSEAERAEFKGPCSLCGVRRSREPRLWGIWLTYLNRPLAEEDNPAQFIICGRCRGALREIAEMCCGLDLHGVIELQADAPY